MSTVLIILALFSFKVRTTLVEFQLNHDRVFCSGETISYLCTVGGRTVIWRLPDGDFTRIQVSGGLQEGNEGIFHWKLHGGAEDSNVLQSTLTFPAANGIEIGCRNRTEHSTVYLNVQVEGTKILIACTKAIKCLV